MCIDMKKNDTYTHFSAVLHFCSLAIAICVMAFTMNSCQEEEFGFTKEEIHQVAVERDYNKEFHKEFPVIDPNHTWMCEPDTFYYKVPSLTRAIGSVSINGPLSNSSKEMTNDEIRAALNYMPEGEDNRKKCNLSFEYLAVEDSEYDIYPVFWGRKFCDNNTVGVYYIDENGEKKDLNPDSGFWSDQWGQVSVKFTDGCILPISSGDKPINEKQKVDGRSDADWNKVVPLTHEHDGKEYTVDKFILPHFKLTVPAGTKWGLYLRTKKNQTDDVFVNWYSNAEHNADHVSAAATFSFGGVTYCCFEDAPHNLHNGAGTGKDNCGYGHFDTDFNDIVMLITPRPIETTYRALKYRVMCEDLGGTFDWDFNDVVYDVIYEDGKGGGTNATVSIVLQAVGGTLPVQLAYNSPSDNFTSQELHELMANQRPVAGLYEPINALGSHRAITSKTVHTINLGFDKDPNIDVREFAQYISVIVEQKEDVTNTVTFPVAPKEQGGNIPQCFMTSTRTDWADELQPITEKYSQFASWVASQGQNPNWWKNALGGVDDEVEVKQP